MPLTAQQFDLVRDHLVNKTTGRCPMCAGENWTIGDIVYLHVAQSYFPAVTVTCSTCYFVASYSAQELGLA